MYDALARALSIGRMVVIDGGTGTDIQTRGGGMNDDIWCAEANFTHPGIVEAVHRGYIDAGAELIIANSYPTSPLLFDSLGRADEVARYDAQAVALARASVTSGVAVGGSFSVMRPTAPDGDRTDMSWAWSEGAARELLAAKAAGLAAAGVDVIVMEMMRETTYSVWAVEAALATGLPVWVGLAAEYIAGELSGFSRPGEPLGAVAERIAALRPAAISIMHTSANDTAAALAVVRRHWDGPLGTYPEAGYFQMPNWEFDPSMTPDVLVEFTERWVDEFGVTIIGGCCGTGPDHIRALRNRWPEPLD